MTTTTKQKKERKIPKSALNDHVRATEQQRRLANDIRHAKAQKGPWETFYKRRVAQLRESMGNRVDVTLVDDRGIKVASITENLNSPRDYDRFFESPYFGKVLEEFPDFFAEADKYRRAKAVRVDANYTLSDKDSRSVSTMIHEMRGAASRWRGRVFSKSRDDEEDVGSEEYANLDS